ncbi:MAG: class I SAM-dependent methyltransferase [Bacteroidota bacterium]
MKYTISDQLVLSTLAQMHRQASQEFPKILKGLAKAVFRKLQPEDMKDTYIAITQSQGEFIYDLLLKKGARNIVEFGTSFGISTLYLAAAAQQNGGRVITTELLPEKCRVARQNFEKAGLASHIELREGDAMQTLREVPDQIDFLLLDGWNDLYLPLLKLLEPRFAKNCLIYTDNASFKSARPLLLHFASHPNKYKSQRLYDDKGGSELTEYIG